MSNPGGARSSSRTGVRFGATAATLVLVFATVQLVGASFAGAASGLLPGDLSTDLVAAGPFTYNHLTLAGTGPNQPRYDSRTISNTSGVVESLEGGDFACGDLVVFFDAVSVRASATGANGTAQIDMSFLAEPTGQPGAGFDDIVSASISTNDNATGGGNVSLSGNESVSLTNEHAGTDSSGKKTILGTVVVGGLDPGERVIAKVVAHLGCLPGSTPTGNLQTRILAGRIDGTTFSIGAQTIPFMKIENLAQPGLTVTKTCPATASAGDAITYGITIKNSGTDNLTNVTVNDSILGNLTSSFSGSLAAGASQSHTFSYTVKASDPDPLVNTVTVTAVGASSETSVTAKTSCTTAVPKIDVTIAKSANVTTVTAGGNVVFTLTAQNTSATGTAKSVKITDTFPAGVSIVTASGCTIAGQTVTCNVGDLAAGAKASVTITVTTSTASCPQISNTAHVAAANESAGSTANNNSNAVIVGVTCPGADVKVTKSASTAQVNSGGSVTYTLVASNVGGSGTATNVTITDTIPAGLTITGTTGPCVVTGQTVTCNVGSLAPGASASVTITVTATDTACPEVSNFASVKADNELAANAGNNVSNSVKVNVTCPSPDVKVEKQDDVTAGGVASGAQFTYTVTATNLGGSVATDVNINDTIPAGLTIVSASNGCTISGQDVTCALGNLAAGASASVTITVQATDGACPEVVNHATVTAGNEPAGNQANNTSNDVTTLVNCVSPGVAVRIAKTNDADGDGHYTNSEEAKRSGLDVPFRLEIVNTGTVDATITDLTDAFDQQTIDLLNTKCADLNGTTLAAGEAVVCKFTMNNYSPPAASGSLVNTAKICVENAAGDNTDCNVDDSSVRSAEVLGKTVTPTITATPPGATAFTGSNGAIGFGLFALFLLMIGSGMTYLGYRRRARFDG